MPHLPLLQRFHGSVVASSVHVLWFVGPHRFDEYDELLSIFPNILTMCLFEPHPALTLFLRDRFLKDTRVKVFDLALWERDGMADFLLTNNGLSSSLLPLSKHLDFFPQVKHIETVSVKTRTVSSVLNEFGMRGPDLLIMDVQGSENKIARTLPISFLSQLKIIQSEASTVELYCGSGTLRDLTQTFQTHFNFVDFSAHPECQVHGDALFVTKSQSENCR